MPWAASPPTDMRIGFRGKITQPASGDPNTPAYGPRVRWLPARDIYGWEHSKSNEGLKLVAQRGSWERDGIAPILVKPATPGPESFGRPWVVVDGHHRLNAAKEVAPGASIPALILGEHEGSPWLRPPQQNQAIVHEMVKAPYRGALSAKIIRGPAGLDLTLADVVRLLPPVGKLARQQSWGPTNPTTVTLTIQRIKREIGSKSKFMTTLSGPALPAGDPEWQPSLAALATERIRQDRAGLGGDAAPAPPTLGDITLRQLLEPCDGAAAHGRTEPPWDQVNVVVALR